MKKISISLLVFLLSFSSNLFADINVQIIHNSADVNANSISVWADIPMMGEVLVADSLEFRTATPFLQYPNTISGQAIPINLRAAGASVADSVWANFSTTFAANESYVIVANGIFSNSTGYNPSPTFDLAIYSGAQINATLPTNTDILVAHGSTDAPAVDVFVQGNPTPVVSNLAYNDFDGYLTVPTADFVLDITAAGNPNVLFSYEANLASLGLQDSAITIVASGFVNPTNNNNGADFGLWVALPSGGNLIELPPYFPPTSKIQFIHNSADFIVANVDIWVDDSLAVANLAFRNATSFLDFPPSQSFDISIQPAGSVDTTNAPYKLSRFFDEDSTYILVAHGVFDTASFTPSPSLELVVYAEARQTALQANNTDVLYIHGSIDAPAVDFFVSGDSLPFVTNLAYNDFDGYYETTTTDFIIDVTAAGDTNVIRRYLADLDNLGLQGEAVSILASGFLNTGVNNGFPFGLWLARANGGALIQLNQPPYDGPTARAQIIHNSADQAISSIDIWVNDVKEFANFNFRTATPFFDIPSNSPVDITIQPINSLDTSNAAFKTTLLLDSTESYIFVANGIASPFGYSPDTALSLDVFNLAQEFAQLGGNTDVLLHHGSTDAPLVDFQVQGNPPPAFSLGLDYTDFDGYFPFPTNDYVIDVLAAGTTNIVESYEANFSTLNLDSAAVTILASGFLDPSQNSNGPAFGLWMARATGGSLIPLPVQGAPPSVSNIQIIHNSADTALSTVDVWLDDSLAFAGVNFRTATPFFDLLSNIDVDISFQTPGAADTANAIFKNTYNFAANTDYVLVADGLVSTAGFTPQVPFSVEVYTGASQTAVDTNEVDILFHHGATDAPSVDMAIQGLAAFPFLTNAAYTDFQGYFDFANNDFIFELYENATGDLITSYEANFLSLGWQGEAVTILASGFLDPSQNANGADFGLWAARPSGGALIQLPELVPPPVFARLQLIHNAADISLSTVDVWLDDSLAFAGVDFRTASPFFDILAETDVDISFLPPNSLDTNNAVFKTTVNLTENETYIAVANGIASATGYTPNIAFDVYNYFTARETGSIPTQTDLLVFHGATDAPAVDIYRQGTATPLFSNLNYSDFDGYTTVPSNDIVLDVTAAGSTSLLFSYAANLNTLSLQGEAITVLASGFLDPSQNSNGESFGLWAAIPSGGALIELPLIVPPITTARLQIIHNSADTAAAQVDVWIEDTLAFAAVDFRTATPFFDFEAESPIDVTITAVGAADTSAALYKQTFNLDENEIYIAVADGILPSSTGYNPNQAFAFNVFQPAREVAGSSTFTSILTYHGATDAPNINITSLAVPQALASDMAYSEFQGYTNVLTNNIVLNVFVSGTAVPLASYAANLSTLGLSGLAVTVLASGFDDPSNNNNGADFGLWMSLPAGGALIELPEVSSPVPTSGIQFIHNSPDVALPAVDVWVDEVKVATALAFREATAFIDVDVTNTVEIAFTPTGSTDNDTYYHKDIINLISTENYVMILHGIFSPTGYNPAPFIGTHVYQGARQSALNSSETDVLFYHGATDLFAIDGFLENDSNAVFQDLSYSDFEGYIPFTVADYQLDIYPNGATNTFSNLSLLLASDNLTGQAITVLASGFLNTADNSNGANLTYWYAKPSGGTLTQLPFLTSNEEQLFLESLSIYPNPTNNLLNISYKTNTNQNLTMNVYDMTGRIIFSEVLNNQLQGKHLLQINTSEFAKGMYFLEMMNGEKRMIKKFQVSK